MINFFPCTFVVFDTFGDKIGPFHEYQCHYESCINPLFGAIYTWKTNKNLIYPLFKRTMLLKTLTNFCIQRSQKKRIYSAFEALRRTKSKLRSVTVYREPETQQNARPFGWSMAERQSFGCLGTWHCSRKQKRRLCSPLQGPPYVLGQTDELFSALIWKAWAKLF